jgi:CubicO group peptidase (beta-lactamase class C family)
VDQDTIFEAGSVSKTVFGYIVMKLCEKRVLDLDVPLTRYTPDRILKGGPRLDLITTRHVLSHTTGLQNWRSTKEPLAIHFTPGERFSYSGEGYSYMQSVVTHLAGHVNPNDCRAFEDGFRVCATDFDAARYGSAGGLHTTPTEYAKFLIEIMNPRPGDAYRLSTASLREMVRPQVKVTESISWGLGWTVEHTKAGDFIAHSGDNPGYKAMVAASIQRKAGFVIMTNGDRG